ncbi:MAG: CBS domain-containing protein [Candidatus Diapherotrites archaeon]|nr:CBS domain-containing protein [Candidatus Diapherotrites archaeon]
MQIGVKIADVMRKSVVTVKPGDNCEKALKYMVELDIGSVIVAEDHNPIGILTDSNLLERVFYDHKDAKKILIKEVMSHPIRTIESTVDLQKASQVMRDLKIKRLPVVDNNKLVGIVTETDIIAVSPALFELVAEAVEMRCGLPEKEVRKISGVCETCNAFSEELVNMQGVLKCPECRE